MPRRKRKTEMEKATDTIMGFANLVDVLFMRYTGKTMGDLIKESGRPKELPVGEKQTTASEPGMPLADAYMVLGLKPDASIEDVKKHYRNLANLFHPDKTPMGGEAIKLINRAYERITKGRGTGA